MAKIRTHAIRELDERGIAYQVLMLGIGAAGSGCDDPRPVLSDTGVRPCLKIAPDGGVEFGVCLGAPQPDARVGPCLEPPPPDAYVGPCLEPPPPDVGPCLKIPPPEVGPCLFVGPDAGPPIGALDAVRDDRANPARTRRALLDKHRAALPADLADRLEEKNS